MPRAVDDLVIEAVQGSSATDVWAVGYHRSTSQPAVYHFNGSSWVLDPLRDTFPTPIHDLAVLSATDAWIVGDNANVAHFDGVAWTASVVADSIASHHLIDRVHAHKGGLWLSGKGDRGGYYRYDDGAWTWQATPEVATQVFKNVWASGPDDIWVAGGHAAHYDGTTWTDVLPGREPLETVHGTARDDVWMVGSRGTSMSMWAHKAFALHFDGSSWTDVPLPEGVLLLRSVYAVSRTEAYAVGNGADAIRWDGTAWRRVLTGVERSSGLPTLAEVYCPPGGRPIAGGTIGPVILHGL